PETALAPQHRRAQRSLRPVVGRLDAMHPREGPQRRPPLDQLPAQPRGLAVWTFLPTPQQPPQRDQRRLDTPWNALGTSGLGPSPSGSAAATVAASLRTYSR